MTFRIRIVTLDTNEGGVKFEAAPARGRTAAWGFAAYMGKRGEAQLESARLGALRFPLDGAKSFDVAGEKLRLCYRSLGERGGEPYGAFIISSDDAIAGTAEEFEVAFKSGMSVEPMFFAPDRGADPGDIAKAFDSCGVDAKFERFIGMARVIDDRRASYPADTGKWRLKEVY